MFELSCVSTKCFSLYWQKIANSRSQKKENFAINSPYIRKTNSPSFIQFFVGGQILPHFETAFCQFSGVIYSFYQNLSLNPFIDYG